jgi:hypothetical protein
VKKKMKKILLVLAVLGLILGMRGIAMAAGTATGNMDVSATLTDSCTVSASTMAFGSIEALASTAAVTATSANLQVACTAGTSPKIWSDSTRTLVNGGNNFAFNLSQTSGAVADDLPTTTVAAEAIIGYTATGSLITVPLYGKILPANFGSKPAGSYLRTITVSVDY